MNLGEWLKNLGNAAVFFIWILVLVWYVRGHFGRRWWWFWLFTLYVVLANVFKHEIRGY